MKRIIPVSAIILVAGCGTHSNDPQPPHFKAPVSIVNGKVCVKVQPQNDEKLSMLIIGEPGNESNKLSKVYSEGAISVTSDQCIPTYDYRFTAGNVYTFDIILESLDKKGDRTLLPYLWYKLPPGIQ